MTRRLSVEAQAYYDAASALIRAASLVSHRVDEVVRPHGLTFARFEVLLLLSWSRRGQMGLTRIGDQLMVHQASITGVVDRLETDGLARRVPHPSDRRITLAQITNRGRLVVAQATETIAEHLDLGFDDQTAEEIFYLVQKLRHGADDISVSRF